MLRLTLSESAHFLKLLMMSSSVGPVFLFDSLFKDACKAHQARHAAILEDSTALNTEVSSA